MRILYETQRGDRMNTNIEEGWYKFLQEASQTHTQQQTHPPSRQYIPTIKYAEKWYQEH